MKKRIAYLNTTGVASGHIINNETNVMEDAGEFFNPGGPMNSPLERTFDMPGSGVCQVVLSAEAHNEVLDQDGWWGIKIAGATVTGSRRFITSGGLGRKRRFVYMADITGTPASSVTIVWGLEGSGPDHIRMNLADVDPQMIEVWEVPSTDLDGSINSTLTAMTQDAGAAVVDEGAAASHLPALGQSLAAVLIVEAGAASVLPTFLHDAVGRVIDSAAIASVLPTLLHDATASVIDEASVSSTLPLLTQFATDNELGGPVEGPTEANVTYPRNNSSVRPSANQARVISG